MTDESERLPCGCLRGHYLCREAQRLWQEATIAYYKAMGNDDWARFDKVMAEYKAHFGEGA